MAKVIMYTTPTCVYCKMAKEFFKAHDVAYDEHDVAQDAAAQKEMFDKSHQMGVPVIDVNGEIIVGFDKGTLKKALGIKE